MFCIWSVLIINDTFADEIEDYNGGASLIIYDSADVDYIHLDADDDVDGRYEENLDESVDDRLYEDNEEYYDESEEDPERPNYESEDNDGSYYYEYEEPVRKKKVRLGNGYSGISYKDWVQGMSRSEAVCVSGCRIVSFTRILYMAGFTEVENPDEYFAWGRANGLFTDSGAEYTPMGSSLIAYAKAHDGVAEIVKEYDINGYASIRHDAIMDYLRAGFYVMLWGKDHQTLFANEESINLGTPVICDTYTLSGQYSFGKYRNFIRLSDYGYENESQYYDKITIFSVRKNNQIGEYYAPDVIALEPNYSDYEGNYNRTKAVFRINYQLDGGVNGYNPSTYTEGESFGFMNPTKEGYRFDGWYTQADYSNEIAGVSANSYGDITVYAKWISVDDNSKSETKANDSKGNGVLIVLIIIVLLGAFGYLEYVIYRVRNGQREDKN